MNRKRGGGIGQLRAVVIGAGWAGEGHTRALQWCSVDVQAICARQDDVVRAVANRLGVAGASTDWQRTVRELQPDIVALATPAGLRTAVAEVAAPLGCHLLCDKPLATTGEEAGCMYRLVLDAGVKHAYAATHRYGPEVVWLGELVQRGEIGKVREIVCTFRTAFAPFIPWSWSFSLAQGGGRLNNGFPHWLGILQRITGGELTRAIGESRVLRDRAPVLPAIHDFRSRMDRSRGLTPEDVAGLEWREADADWAFSALLRFGTPAGEVAATIAHGPGVATAREGDGMRLYGDGGTLLADGVFSYQVSCVRRAGDVPEPLPVPRRLLDDLPHVGDEFQNKWCALVRDFIADIRGEPHGAYLTFRDGWRYQLAIDAIRSGRGWYELPG